MHLAALQNRRSRTDPTPKSESLRGQSFTESHVPPQHPLPLSSPGLSLELDGSYHCINTSDAQGNPVQPAHDSEQYPLDRGSFAPTQPSPNHRAINEGHHEVRQHAPTTEEESEASRNTREAELLQLYEKFNDLSAKRVRARQSRMALRYKREDELELRVRFMKHLNSFFADMDLPEAGPIMEEYQLLQVATEDYLRLEDSYRQEEDELEEQEYLLSISIESLTRSQNWGPEPNFQPGTRTWSPVSDDDAAVRELPHCITAYLSRIGDERILQERLADLDSEWFFTTERQAQRLQYKLSMEDEDSKYFLKTYDEERARIWKELNNAQMDVVSLHAICLEEGHRGFDYEDLSALNIYQHYVDDTLWAPETGPLRLPLDEYFVFSGESQVSSLDQDYPIPLEPNSGTADQSPLRRFQFSQALQQTSSIRSNEFINKWMLHQLRISSIGIWHLQRSPRWQSLRAQGLREYEISQLILDWWFSDETAQAPSSDNSYLNNADDGDADTFVGYANGQGRHLKKASSQSLVSSPRVSAPKLGPRRYSRP
ncbi:hypothetical protein AN6372.2 [Aspergillus nidulans FGSC A4]|uniref:Uncharacterized protein n=1 Tax=Emericella nidulans (strain FGSC A4 / ATCC 38163 / CBS 112.46 / NRRL 194 / M139) TaxID=227321 RepID=Q5AZA8_EMENI|nr:hypothetical protein [Aspergillus nidulans FGSC A4]EAA58756.1 hypothetical protein AN6372.2 [Aspergillus nidulans FGSC A4]CBF69604.1 TPA: conserved hypothetical protein [Aspergillus nidulans FGSC A4]|eukprot:XP_663976.1 hypothetical protein AN6372.2 [Aspergillus nidulans FGSC A4]